MFPEIFQTKYFTLNTLWVFFAIAIIASFYIAIKQSVKSGLKIQFLSENSWKLFFWAIIGARILSLIINYDTYFYEFSGKVFLQTLYIWDKGLSLWGALIALSIAFYYLCKKYEQDFWKWLDVLVPSIIIGFAIGNIGTFFEGSNYGKETSLPWGVNFESPAIKYTVPIHPTQIYAFLYSLVIGITLIIISKTEKINQIKKPGFIGIVGICIYSFFKFLEHFVRGDDCITIYGIRITQIFALLVALTFGVLLYIRYNTSTSKKRIKRSKTKNKGKSKPPKS